MKAALRSVGVILLGLVAGMLAITAGDWALMQIYPLPGGVETGDPEAFSAAIRAMPAGAFAGVLASHALGTLVAAAVAARLAGRAPMGHALAVGVLFLAAGVANILMIYHPTWFIPLDLAAYPTAAYLGGRLAARRPAPPEPAAVAA